MGAKENIKNQNCTFSRSYGAMTSVFEFLTPLETIKLQFLNQWFYSVGIQRIQIKIQLPYPVYFPTHKYVQVLTVPTFKLEKRIYSGGASINGDGWQFTQVGLQAYITGGVKQPNDCSLLSSPNFERNTKAGMLVARSQHSTCTYKGKYLVSTGASPSLYPESANKAELYLI